MDGPQLLCVLLTDADGRVISGIGPQHSVTEPDGFPEDAPVRTWRDVLGGVLESDVLPEKLPAGPASYSITSADGQGYRVHVLPLSAHGRSGSVVLLQGAAASINPGAQRLCSLGMLAAGAAHEFNNLLAVISGWVELALEEECCQGEQADYLSNVAGAVMRLSKLTQSLLNFARAQSGELKRLELNELVRDVLELVDYRLKRDNIELTCDLDEIGLLVEGDDGELSQALLNLTLNARHAMPEGGKLSIATRREEEWALIEVRDTGCGIPSEIQEQIFNPFFTTRGEEGGTGLGLCLCKEIAAKHGGRLSLESKWGNGTAAVLRIPLLREGVPVGGE